MGRQRPALTFVLIGVEVDIPVEDGDSVLRLPAGSSVEDVLVRVVSGTDEVLFITRPLTTTSADLIALCELLDRSEKHAMVVSRLVDPESMESAIAIAADEVEFSIAPVPTAGMVLVRRSIASDYGWFDVRFESIDAALIALSLRINAAGYSTIVANRVVVAGPTGSVSPGPADSALIETLYPFRAAAMDDYARFGRGAMGRFESLMIEPRPRRASVLIDLYRLSPNHDGSSRYVLSFLAYLRKHPDERLDISVTSSDEATEFFQLAEFGFPLVRDSEFGDRLFDVGIAMSAAGISAAQLVRLNEHCLKWIVSHLDVISLRSWHLRSVDWARRSAVRDSLRFADEVVTISKFSAKDARDYFDCSEVEEDRVSVVPLGRFVEPVEQNDTGVRFEQLPDEVQRAIGAREYIFVVGNGFPHKQVELARRVLALAGFPVMVLGAGSDGIVPDGLGGFALPSGTLSESLVHRLYADSRLIVFPSAYEGFGFPIAEAAAEHKPTIVFDTEVAREVTALLGLDGLVGFFSSFDELAAVVERQLRATGVASGGGPVRTIDDYSAELARIVRRVAETPIERERLAARWDYFAGIAQSGFARPAVIPGRAEVLGLPTHIRLGETAVALVAIIGADGIERSKRGTAQALDGATELGHAPIERGEAAFPVRFDFAGTRTLEFAALLDGSSSALAVLVEITVAEATGLDAAVSPTTLRRGESFTVSIRPTPPSVEAAGMLSVFDGDTELAASNVSGADASVEIIARYEGTRHLRVVFEAGSGVDYTWGESIVSVVVEK